MFKERIRTTPLYNEKANFFFQDIIDEVNDKPDDSLVSTLRALLYGKLGDTKFRSCTYSTINVSDWGDNLASRLADYMIGSWPRPENTTALYLAGIRNVPDGGLEKIEEYFTSRGYENLEKIKRFFTKGTQVRAFVKDSEPGNEHAVVITTGTLHNMALFHTLQCTLPLILRWYFTGEHELVRDSFDHNLSKVLRDPAGAESYKRMLAEVAAGIDMEESYIRHTLEAFSKGSLRHQRDSVKREIQNNSQRIDSYLAEVRSMMRNNDEKRTILMGLEARVADGAIDEELFTYLKNNKTVSVYKLSGNDTIVLNFRTYLDNVDEEIAEAYIQNHRGTIYENNRGFNDDDLEKLLMACLVDRTMKVRVCARMYFSGTDCNRWSDDSLDDILDEGYMGSPHVVGYDCKGGYATPIYEALAHGDQILAFENAIRLVASLNMDDYTVLGWFIRRLTEDYNHPCIELSDGTVVSPKEALNHI